MSREDLCQKYRTKNVKLAINRAIRAELNGGDVLQGLYDAHQANDRDAVSVLAPQVRALQNEVRVRYGMAVTESL